MSRRLPQRPRQSGVALLIVLMIVALVTILATEMATRLQLQVQRTANLKDNNQAYWYAMGAEAFARQSLKTLFEQTADKIALDQPWAQPFAYPVPNGRIEARLEDMQSCFNLNAVLGESAQGDEPSAGMAAFHQMLLASELEISSYEADTLRDSLADWLDSDSQVRPYGAEDSEYEAKQPPYLAANALLTAQSELRLIHGVAPAWLRQLLPLVCVIPGQTELALNVNTITEARAAVLAGATGLSLAQAQDVINSRPPEGWEEAADFFAEPAVAALNLDDSRRSWFTVTSSYFLLHTKASYNAASFTMTSVLQASEAAPATILRREFLGVD